MIRLPRIKFSSASLCAVIGLALIMAGCEEFVSMSPDEASEALLSGAECECNSEGALGCVLRTAEQNQGKKKVGTLEDADFCNADLIQSGGGQCTCALGKLVCTFFPGPDGSPYGRTEFGQKFINVSANTQAVSLVVGTCEEGSDANTGQGCFAPCDPSKPTCSDGLSCQPRDDGTFICFDAAACSPNGGADQPTEAVNNGETTCKCEGTSLVCTDGTVAEFNPACGVGSGGGSTCGNTVCDPGEDSTNCQVDCGKP